MGKKLWNKGTFKIGDGTLDGYGICVQRNTWMEITLGICSGITVSTQFCKSSRFCQEKLNASPMLSRTHLLYLQVLFSLSTSHQYPFLPDQCNFHFIQNHFSVPPVLVQKVSFYDSILYLYYTPAQYTQDQSETFPLDPSTIASWIETLSIN